MRISNYLASLALLFSFQATAADYYWQLFTYSTDWKYGTFTNADPVALCTSHLASNASTIGSFERISDTQGNCVATNRVRPTQISKTPIFRLGDSCPSGQNWDSSLSKCVTPFADQGKPCPDQSGSTADIPKVYDKSGQCVLLNAADQETTCKFYGHSSTTKPLKVKGTINDQGEAVPPPTVKDSGCAATVVASQCVVKPPKFVKSQYSEQPAVIPGGAVCAVEVRYTGAVASTVTPENLQAAKDDVCLDPAKCNLPVPQQSTEKKPCNYVTGADGSQTCVSSSGVTKEGKTQCGTVNGVLTCSDSLAKPIGNGIIVSTKVNSEGLGDGKTKVIKTDTMTSYTCGSGKSTCTSSTTTSTTTTIKDGAGNTESVAGTCTGPACPDKNGNPDGDGDGFGDCVSGNCSEDSGSPSLPGLDDVDSYQVTTQKFFDRVKGSPIASSVSSISVPTSGTAPTFTTSGIEALGGASLDFSIISTLFDGVKSVLSAVMKAVWCFVAVFIFLNA